MYAVETKGLVKKFNEHTAVDNLHLRVPEGSIYGFLGPNGAGKTTTIKMLTGLSKPTAGEMKICGKDVKFGSIKNRIDIGFLPDVPFFYNWMNAREFLKLSGDIFGIDSKTLKERTQNLLELVGLSDVNKKIGSYSRGMKQRLGIAQALINEPKVVFLDEPTSALDPIGRKEVMDIIEKLSGKATVFFSTHILSDVERVCDRVVIINKGKVMIEDDMEHLRHSYSSRGIVLEADTKGRGQELIDTLKSQDWVKEIPGSENGGIIVYVKDMKKAQLEIPAILSQKGFGLKKFAILEPTLEDIFLKVVNE